MASKAIYPKLSGGAGVHGSDYQIKLLTLFLLEGYQNGKYFLLSTENKLGVNFDDIIYETEEGTILLQAKHKEDVKDKKQQIFFNDVFPTTGNRNEFNVYKYADSYPIIRKSFCNVHSLILCTNTDITNDKTNEIKKYISFEKMDDSHIFIFSDQKFYYTFNEKAKKLLLAKNSTVSEDDIDQFLDKFQLVCISDKNIDDRLEERAKAVELFEDSVNVQNLINFLFQKVKIWFMGRKGLYLTQQDAEAYLVNFRCQNFTTELEKYNVEFKMSHDINRYTCHVIQNRETVSLYLLKVYQNLGKDKVLIVQPEDTMKLQNKIISAFKIPEFVSLIIPVFRETYPDLHAIIVDVIKETSTKLYKKITFITDEDYILQKLNDDLSIQIQSHDDCINFESFSDLTKIEILQKNVIFQSKNICIQDLIGSQTEILDESTLLKLIDDTPININQCANNNTVIDFYVPRIMRYQESFSTKTLLSEDEFCGVIVDEKKDKVILISDRPGMGKTVLLSRLQWLLNQKYHYWIIKIHLNEHTKIFKNHLENCTVPTLEDLLFSNKNRVVSEFEKQILNLPKRCIVMFDAVDEICPDYIELVLKLITSCKHRNNVRKIIVSSRQHCQKLISECTNCSIYSIDPFSEQDIIGFLSNYWGNKLQSESALIKDYAKIVSEKLETNTQNTSSLIGIPLQMRLVAEILQDGCLNYISMTGVDTDLPEKLNTAQLYKMFIVERKKIYIDEKNKADGIIEAQNVLNKMFDVAIMEHKLMAIKGIFNETEMENFQNLQPLGIVPETSLLRMGILQKNETTLHFVHHTFMEYFVADLLWEMLNSSIVDEQFVYFLLSNVFSRKKYITIQSFMDSILEDIEVSDNTLELCGRVTSKIVWSSHPDVSYLVTYGRYNLLKLMLIKCNDCTQFLQSHGLCYTDLLYESIAYFPIFELLFKKGGNIFAISSLNKTLLHYAVTYNSEKVVMFLIKNGLDINAKDSEGNSPQHLAAEKNLVNMVEILNDNNIDIFIKNNNGESALHSAAKHNSIDVIKLLCQQGFDVDCKDQNGMTPFLTACRHASFDCAKYLIERQCDVTLTNTKAQNALHLLASSTLSLSNVLSKSDKFHLMNIAVGQFVYNSKKVVTGVSKELLQIFLNESAKAVGTSSEDEFIYEYLKQFSTYYFDELIKLAEEDEKETHAQIIFDKHCLNIMKTVFTDKEFLRAYQFDPTTNSISFVGEDLRSTVLSTQYYLDREAGPSITNNVASVSEHHGHNFMKLMNNSKFRSSFLNCISKNIGYNESLEMDKASLIFYKEIIVLLLENNVNINSVSNERMTALHYAIKSENFEVVQCLLEAGADKTVKNEEGMTPIDMASQMEFSPMQNLFM